MLYQKMEENTSLQRKFEQSQMQQVMFLSQIMQNQQALGNMTGLTGGSALNTAATSAN